MPYTALFSRYPVTDSLRRRFPVSTSFSKFFDLDRCYSISRVPVDNGKEFVIFELHMSAYGNSDEVTYREVQAEYGELTVGLEESAM